MNLPSAAIPRFTASIETGSSHSWSDGRRRSRADSAMVSGFDVETVDAVFEEPSLNFLRDKESSSDRTIENLAAQLSALEIQCSKLRKYLEVASNM